MAKLKAYGSLICQYGLYGCALRFWFDLRRKTGLLKRRFPAWAYADRPLATWLADEAADAAKDYRGFRERSGVKFFFPPGRPPAPPKQWLAGAVEESENLLAGRFRYFSDAWGELGYPEVDWFLNPFLGRSARTDAHWCDASDFEPARGDIKFIWEPSRFAWAYALARAYAATGDEKYPEAFWRLVESWMAANPPNFAPNWQCGQEIAIRLMACAFALHAFWSSPASSQQRVASLVVLLAGSAERIEGNIDAARQQRSNHAATEAAGLFTAGVLLPELRDAARWRRLGKRILEDEAGKHNWPDGSYVQHSMNYQRMTLHNYLWCLRLAELNDEQFSERTRRRLELSYRFLHQMQDDAAGRLPNYGSNDGALILGLNGCGYQDFRPLIGSMHYLLAGKRPYGPGPWQEDLLWLFGPEAMQAPLDRLERISSDFHVGGYYTIRGQASWAMTRCHTYRNRPGQADMLHLDLWWRGINVLRDSGTFSYYDPPGRWNEYFLSTAAHNTAALAGENQMVKGPRFQWYDLTGSKFLGRRRRGDLEMIAAEHYGYRRLPCRATHRRVICRLGEACWLIVDDLLGSGTEQVRLFWHLADSPCELAGETVRMASEAGEVTVRAACTAKDAWCRLERGLENEERMGWQSLYYGRRTPAPTLCVEANSALPVRFVTLVCLGGECALAESDAARLLALGRELEQDADWSLGKPARGMIRVRGIC